MPPPLQARRGHDQSKTLAETAGECGEEVWGWGERVTPRTLHRIWRSSATRAGCWLSVGFAGTRCGLLSLSRHYVKCGGHVIVACERSGQRAEGGGVRGEGWGPHLSSFMKRFFSRSSSLALTAHTKHEERERTRCEMHGRTVGPLLHVLHKL